MITNKELEALMNKVDGAVDKQYDFIREMKGIKNYLWELKATMQESPVEETITPPIVERTVAPIVPEVVEEEKLTPMVVEEKLAPAIIQENLTPAVTQEAAEETPEETTEKVTEEVTAEETTITPQQAGKNSSYHENKPDFEKQV